MTRAPLLILFAAACAPERPATPPADTTAVAAVPADSLVMVLPDSTKLWLTPGRVGTATSGESCREHGVKLEKGGESRLVPLLYVRSAPRPEGKKLVAALSTNCVDGATYEIDPKSAHPTLWKGRE